MSEEIKLIIEKKRLYQIEINGIKMEFAVLLIFFIIKQRLKEKKR